MRIENYFMIVTMFLIVLGIIFWDEVVDFKVKKDRRLKKALYVEDEKNTKDLLKTENTVENIKIDNDYIVIDGKEIRQFNLIRKLDKEYDELVNVLLDKADSFKLYGEADNDYYWISINIKKESFLIWIENKYYSYGTILHIIRNKQEEKLFQEKGISISTVKRIHDIEMELKSMLLIKEPTDNYKKVMDLIK